MHMFGMGVSWLWILVPAALILVGIPIVRTLARRDSRRGLNDGGHDELPSGDTEAQVFRLAGRLGGRLTVSDVVVETGMPAARAEETLQRLTDGVRVRMEVSDTGIVVYEFAELMKN